LKLKFNVDVLECKDVHELPNAWNNDQFRELLELIEYEDIDSIGEDELKEVTALALIDLEPEEAIKAVLELRFGERMTEGQRQDLSTDMQQGRIWEEYRDMAFHEELFNAACMLFWTFDRKFPEPECASVILRLTGVNANSTELLKKPSSAFIARVLNDGMNEHSAMYRLFEDEIASESFPEAEDIIWSFTTSAFNEADSSVEIHLYTSWNWVDELKGVKSYESTAHEDE